MRLVEVWRATPRSPATRLLGGGNQVFTRRTHCHMGSLRSGLRQSEWQPPRRVSSQSQFNVEPWASDSEKLFALSRDGDIHRVDITTETTLSKWRIHSSDDVRCIALASNGTFIAASTNSRVSLWDTTTLEQIGSVIEYTHRILSMTMSSNYDLVTSGDKKITLWTLCGNLFSH